MAIKYKINVLSALKEKGYSTYKIRKEKLFGEATLQKFRNSELVSWENLNTLCQLLNCQPGNIVGYVPEETGEAFCNTLVQNYESSTDKGEFVPFDEAAKLCDVDMKE